MASPVDVPSSDSGILAKPQIFQCSTINNINEEESTEAPLQTPWTLWLDKTVRGCSASEYESNLKKIYTFSTIQGFWAVYNNVPDVGSIQTGYSYHLMREERRPIWEEPYNQGGGTWRFRCNKNDTSKIWKELLLAAIGEQFLDSIDPNDEICGLTVSVRDKFDVVRLWNINAQLEKKASVINKVFKLLPDVEFAEPFYKFEHIELDFGVGNALVSSDDPTLTFEGLLQKTKEKKYSKTILDWLPMEEKRELWRRFECVKITGLSTHI